MRVIPTYNFLLIRMHDIGTDSDIELPEGFRREPYGEVLEAGPDCKVCQVGDLVLFLPQNMIAAFDKGHDERFIIPEPAVFAKCDPRVTQAGVEELKILKNPPEETVQP